MQDDATRSEPARAVWFDGETSRRHDVALTFAPADLVLVEDGREAARWRWDQLRRVEAPRGLMRLSCLGAAPQARLDVTDAGAQRDIQARAAMLDASLKSERGSVVRIVVWSFAAAASLVALTVFGMPLLADRLAPLVPASVERRIGDAADKQLHAMFTQGVCTGEPGVKALAKLARSVGHEPVSGPVVAVVRSTWTNAVALPGRVYLFEPLVAEAKNPDQLAGVLAHELGHVAHRDSMRTVIQNGGASFLLGLLFGDVAGAGVLVFAGRSLIDASHSREVESAADDYARARLEAAGRPARPLGEFLLEMTGRQTGRGFGLFMSHPFSEARLDALSASVAETKEPLLTDEEWRDLKAICKTSA